MIKYSLSSGVGYVMRPILTTTAAAAAAANGLSTAFPYKKGLYIC